MLAFGAFVGECEQTGYGQVHATALAPRQFGQFDVLAGVVEYEPVPHGHAADAEHGLVWTAHGGSTRVLDDVADPCLDFGAGDGADPTIGPTLLAVEPPCFRGVDPCGLLPKRPFLLQPLLVEVSDASFAAFRIHVAVGCFGDGDVLRRPVLRIYLAAEASFIGLRAVRLAVPHTVSGFTLTGLVSGDVRHGYAPFPASLLDWSAKRLSISNKLIILLHRPSCCSSSMKGN